MIKTLLKNLKKQNCQYKLILLDNTNKKWKSAASLSKLMETIKQKINPIYHKIFPSWIEILKRELSDCKTVLDLGCGYNSPLQYCNVQFSVGVELFEPYLLESYKKRIHDEYIKADITKLEFKPKSFDAVVCIEVLEHLDKNKGYELIQKIEEWVKKKSNNNDTKWFSSTR